MTICIQTLKFLLICVATPTKIKVITIFTHPTILSNYLFAVKTLKFFIPKVLFLKNCLKFMIWPMTF